MKNSKRRGAVKVPNVKLRPVQASSASSKSRQTSVPRVGLREDDAPGDAVDLSAGGKPFHGIVLCASGDLDKRTLFSRAQELGAVRSNDFTDKVTHLIADAPGSAKYKCAVERNLPILKATWVEEAYHTWLNGGVVNLEQTMSDHRLPVFSGVKLCITGMEDIALRNKVHAWLAKEGGVYLKSLNATATHLLCCVSDTSAKLKWTRDHNRTQSQTDQIRIVWEEWFWDCIEFGGRWDESSYEITKARPARKFVSQISETIGESSKLPTATLSQHTPLPYSIPTSTLLGDDTSEYGQTYKQRDIGLRIFQHIVQKRSYFESDEGSHCSKNNSSGHEQSQTSSTVPNLKSQTDHIPRPKPRIKPSNQMTDTHADSNSVLTRLSNHRAASFARSSSPPQHAPQPFRRIVSSSCGVAVAPQTSNRASMSSDSRLFTGYKFRAFGEAYGPTLREALEELGAQWLTEDEDQDADFFVVRLVSGGMFWREEDDENERAKYRTECWVERCIFEERICDPNEHVTFTPLKISCPVEGAENLHISLSGLDSAQTCWTKRLVRAIGGNLPLTFSRHSTHLVCPSGCGAKYEKAREWGVSVVGLEWLFMIATGGKIPLTQELEVDHGRGQDFPMLIDARTGRQMDIEGKRKEGPTETEEREVAIIDITNGASQEVQPVTRTGSSLECKEPSKLSKCPTLSSRVVDPGPGSNALLSVTSLESSRAANTLGSTPLSLSGQSPRPTSTTPKPNHTTRRPSAAEIEQDKQTTQIPSSHSPSPLKVPIKSNTMTSHISETRGLRTAITALLGKRSMEVREEADGPQKPSSRPIKRPRPPSRTDLEPGRGLSPALSFATGSPPVSSLSPHKGGVFSEEVQSSLRVIYEDPGQRAEKRKLIALFDGPESGDDRGAGKKKILPHTDGGARTVPKKTMIRRSTRSSGV
ncbi:hypothetical protein JB92DRAFT_2928157 [Gautieria morchelliformis]|nr:hypothetical protein JB92DRAFT_2928157 [Gautieria morchelliformis]